MISKLRLYILFTVFAMMSLVIFGTGLVFAETAIVTATVPSKACPQFTIIGTNVPEALADNSQKVRVTVQVKDCDQALMQNALVSLTTNRAAVDHADTVTAGGDLIKQGYGTGIDGTTGTDGMIYFNVYSEVPGDVIISLKADTILLLGTKDIKFLSVPFPKNISISVTIPPIIGKLLPNYNEKNGTLPLFVPQKQQFDDAKIVNMGVDLQIPLGSFLLMVLIILAIPALSTSNILLLRRIRKEQKAETTKIEAEVEEIHEEITAGLEKAEETPRTPEN